MPSGDTYNEVLKIVKLIREQRWEEDGDIGKEENYQE